MAARVEDVGAWQRPVAQGMSAHTTDPLGLARHLDANDRFHRDSVIGRILHPGTISFRERVDENSVHILIEGTKVSAHVDRYAPLTLSKGSPRYSLWRAVVHNLAHLGEDAVRLVTGRRGEHRCVLDCERVETGLVDGLLGRSPQAACDRRAR